MSRAVFKAIFWFFGFILIPTLLQSQNIVGQLPAKQSLEEDIDATSQYDSISEVVVVGKSATRRAQEQAYAISAIDAKKSYNVTGNLDALVNRLSGVRIREAGGVGSDYSFSLNGFSGRQVKFFLDGLPMDNFGTSFGLNSMSSSMVERVEVYKGVLPVNLGADALGGAVNIVTRKDANYLDASYSFGSFNTHRATANGAYTNLTSGFTVRVNLFYNYSDNSYRVFVPVVDLSTNKKSAPQWVNRFHDQYQSLGSKFEIGVTNKPFADYLLAGVILSGDARDIQNGVTMETVFGAKTAESSSLIPSIRYKKSNLLVDGLTLTLYGAFNRQNYRYTDTTARTYNWLGEWVDKGSGGETSRSRLKNTNDEWLANACLEYTFNEHHSATLNYVLSDMSRETFDTEDPENVANKIPQSLLKQVVGLGWMVKYKRWNATLFGKLYNMTGTSYETVDQFTINERLEKVDATYNNVGYGAAFTYFILQKLQAKLSYEHTYRLPEAIEMFGDGLFNVRNPQLKPENSDNYNLGITYEQPFLSSHTVALEANLLYRDSRDYIQKELQDPSTQYVNLGKVKTWGVEGGLKYAWRDVITAAVSATYQNITDNAPTITTTGYVGAGTKTNPTYGDRLPNIPYLFGNADFGLKFKDVLLKETSLTLGYMLNYVHQYYLSWPSMGSKSTKSTIPEQLSHSVSLGYSLQNGRYNITAECINITDEKLYDNYMLQKPGRAFFIKFRYFLGR